MSKQMVGFSLIAKGMALRIMLHVSGIVRFEKIPRRLQLADLGTGARPHPDFIRLSRSIFGEVSSQEVQPQCIILVST
jgi:hypothetical protein